MHSQGLSQRFTEKIPSISYAMLIVGIALAPFNVYRVKGTVIVSDVFLMLAGVFLLFDALGLRTRVWAPWSMILGAFLMLTGYFVLIILDQGVSPHFGIVHLMVLFYTCFVLPVVIASQRVTDLRQVHVLVNTFMISTVASAWIVICQSQYIELPWIQDDLVKIAGREGGLTLHPNTMGFFASLVVPVCFARALGAIHWPAILVWLFFVVSLMYAIDQSGSRTALVSGAGACIGVVGIFALYRDNTRTLRTVMIVVVGVATVAMMLDSHTESALGRLLGYSETGALADAERELQTRTLMATFWENPVFGNGYDFKGIHNVFVGTLAISGILGLSAQLLREYAVVSRAIKLVRYLPALGSEFPAAVGLLIAYLVWLLSLLKNFQLLERPGFIVIGLLVLYSIHCTKNIRNPRLRNSQTSNSAGIGYEGHRLPEGNVRKT